MRAVLLSVEFWNIYLLSHTIDSLLTPRRQQLFLFEFFPIEANMGDAPLLQQIAADVKLGRDVVIYNFVNLYGCSIGDGSRIGAFVEIQKNVTVGAYCKISTHTFICEGVTIEDEVFIGHGVMFINDRYPRATANGDLQTEADWHVVPTVVKRGASVGSAAVIMCGVTIGERALVGAGAVVTHDVPDHGIVVGVPSRIVGDVRQKEMKP